MIKTGELSPGTIDLYPLLRNYDVGGGGGGGGYIGSHL